MNKQKFGFSFQKVLAILVVVLFISPMAYAQDDEDSDTFTLEEITVTAEKRESNLQKVPISIQTVSGVELVTEAKQRIDDIMRGVVGVSSQGSQVGTDFYMRGLGKVMGMSAAGITQSPVAVLIDGVYQNRGEVVRGGTVDMAQAEVMRGTQSTTLGGSSLAGAVSLVSNDPVFNYESSGSLGIGNYSLLTLQGVLNVPLADNQAVRIAYSNEKREGYISSGAGDSDLQNARLKYRWQPSEDLNIVASWNHQLIGGNGVDNGVLTFSGKWEGYDTAKDPDLGCTSDCYGATMGDPPIYGWVDGEDYYDRDDPWDDGYPADSWPNYPFRHTTIDQYSADIDWDLGIGTLTVTPSYQEAHFKSMEPPRGNSARGEDRRQETVQFDAQLTSADGAPLEWLGGLYYYDTSFSGTFKTIAMNGPRYTGMCVPGDNEYAWCWRDTGENQQTTYAAYTNLSYPVFDDFRLNAGLRYTHDEQSSLQSDEMYGTDKGPFDAYTYGDPTEGEWEAVTYRAGGQYDLTDQVMIYALFATGYQPGRIAGGKASDKQTLEQWTTGVKTRLLGNRLQINVEGFHSTYHDRPMQGSLSYYTTNYEDLNGSSRCGDWTHNYTVGSVDGEEYGCYSEKPLLPDLVSKGVDIEINWLLTENDRIDASAEYLKSVQGKPLVGVTEDELKESGFSDELAAEVYSNLDSTALAYDGLTLQNSPEWTANVSYSHIFDLPNGSTLTPKLNVEYRDTYWSWFGGRANAVQPGDSVQDAYTLWNAFLNWTSSDDKFNISAYIKNIENKAILNNLTVEPDPTAPQYVTLSPPRTFGVIFSLKL